MIVYFDLDNVLAAFQKGGLDMCGINIPDQAHQTKENEEAMWAALRTVPHFYDKLEMMPGAKEMFDYAYGLLGPAGCQILSAVPNKKHGMTNAAEDKTAWCKRMLAPDIEVNIVHSKHEKRERCQGPDCVLVDDLQGNIDEWESCGGTGVHYTDSQDALRKLRAILEPVKE
ncbi:MAG: hypothetical protein LUD51_02910 [Clostridia bacterium]|nr:hypothetical protein [Clostridia bacterium]